MRPLVQLGPRDRRAVLVGGAVLAPMLAFSLVGKPYLHARRVLAEQVHEQQDLLRRELELVQSGSHLSNDLSAAASSLAHARPRLFPARDPLSATALLVSAVSETARQQGVLVEAVESRPAEYLHNGLMAVQVDMRGRGDLEGLLRWLDALETGPKLLRVEQLSVAQIGSGATNDSPEAEALSFAAGVRGFILAPANGDSATLVAAPGDQP